MLDPETQYIREREVTAPNLQLPKYAVLMGIDGQYYAVFENSGDAFEFDLLMPHVFMDCRVACFGQYDNAFELGRLH